MHYVLDTSYLVVVFDVPGMAHAVAKGRILARFDELLRRGGVLHVPVPVIFETCNHIAQISNGGARIAAAEKLAAAVRSSLVGNAPWTITPGYGQDILDTWMETLEASLHRFRTEFAACQIGLTDVGIVMEAERLVRALSEYPHPRPKVHIHTNDVALKAREPDAEDDPVLW